MTDAPEDGPGEGPEGPQPASYLDEVATLTEMVESGHQLVSQGNAIDLSNLETSVADLCRRMAEIPPDDPDAVTEAIEHLVARLGALGDALKAQAERH